MHLSHRRIKGFTLIELLVVIAILALLIGILLPALGAARKRGWQVKCGTNLHHVGQAASSYLSENNGVFPPSYAYASDNEGNYDLMNQEAVNDHPYGYIHWSYSFYSKGQAPEESFQCPGMPTRGAPRTNPGANGWLQDQVDQNGATGPSAGALQDKQAEFMAYGGNAAIFPRNKFTTNMSQGSRINQFVNEKDFNTGRTILVAEFNSNWKLLGTGSFTGVLSKSHRSINPFWSVTSGSDEYGADPGNSTFTYKADANYGLRRQGNTEVGWIDQPGVSEINAVGRHHPGGDKWGGTANFLYADGHVECKAVLTTLMNAEWGNRYYALTGDNRVANE